MKNQIPFMGIAPFQLRIEYSEADAKTPNPFWDMHIHEECQLYINWTGDVEFMVEDRLYPITPGSMMIIRPNELHHCIYRKKKESISIFAYISHLMETKNCSNAFLKGRQAREI